MPTAPWRRRRVTDTPRPAGRRWAGRLRRGGSLARQVLVGRVGRRRNDAAVLRNDAAVLRADGSADTSTRRRRFALRRAGRPDLGPGRPDLGSGRATRPGQARLDGQPDPDGSPDSDDLPGLIGLAPVSPVVPAPPGAGPAAGLNIPLLPGERTLGRRIRFAAVNGCTIGSLVFGVSAIFLTMQGADLHLAAAALIASVVFDGLDGALARRLGVASPFGAQMDSLADMCSFGIAAPVVVYAWLAGSAPTALIAPACALVAVCAAIRLARFNVSPKDGRFFCGVPTTMVAAVLALGTLIAPAAPVGFQVAGVVLMALAMVSSFPYAKLARLLRLPPWLLAVPVVGAFIDYRMTFVVVVLAYLASGPLLWLRNRGAV